MCVIDGWPGGMASGDGFRLFTAGLLPQYGKSLIHRDKFSMILGAICEGVSGGIQAQLKQEYDSTGERGWTGPLVSAQMDLTTTCNVEYTTMTQQKALQHRLGPRPAQAGKVLISWTCRRQGSQTG